MIIPFLKILMINNIKPLYQAVKSEDATPDSQ